MKKYAGTIVLFGLYTFFYLVLELVINDCAGFVMNAEQVTLLYGFCYMSVAVGYLSFSFIYKLIKGKVILRGIYISVLGVMTIAMCGVSFSGSASVIVIGALLLHLMSGYLGGGVYYYVSMTMRDTGKMGWYLGIGYAAANAVQFLGILFESAFPAVTIWLEGITLAVTIVLIMWFLIMRLPVPSGIVVPVAEAAPDTKKYILGALAAMALIAMMFGINDGIITVLHAQSNGYVLYSFPRLFAIPGWLLAGAVVSAKNKSIFSFVVLSAMMLMIMSVFLFQTPDTYVISTCFVYFLATFAVMYSIYIFMEIAPSTRNPALVASLGRSTRYFFAGLMIMLSGELFKRGSYLIPLILYVVLIVLLFSVLFFMGHLQLPVSKQEHKSQSERAFVQKYSLTDRETEILTMLADGLSSVQVAQRLFIAEKTVRTHVSNMLSKTGSSSRADLIAMLKKSTL